MRKLTNRPDRYRGRWHTFPRGDGFYGVVGKYRAIGPVLLWFIDVRYRPACAWLGPAGDA